MQPEIPDWRTTVENSGDVESTVHWHGCAWTTGTTGRTRRKSRCNSVSVSPTGSSFRTRRLLVHPHVRQDYAQEMGLYGTILVEP